MAHRDNPEFLSASTIKGNKVVNTAGEDLGKKLQNEKKATKNNDQLIIMFK